MTIPNLLSLLRLAMVPAFAVASLAGYFELALGLFIFAALTDAIDGWLARKLNQISRLGMILDPAADKLMMMTGYVIYTVGGLVETRLPVGLTFSVFARDISLVLAAWLIYSRVHADRFPPNLLGKLSTIVQAVALGVTVGANTVLAPIADLLLLPSHALALGLTLLSGFGYVRQWEMFIDDPELAKRHGIRFVDWD